MADLFGPTAAFEPAATLDEWLRRYTDRIASRAKMDRAVALKHVEATMLDFYQKLFDDGELPEYAADEELLNWVVAFP